MFSADESNSSPFSAHQTRNKQAKLSENIQNETSIKGKNTETDICNNLPNKLYQCLIDICTNDQNISKNALEKILPIDSDEVDEERVFDSELGQTKKVSDNLLRQRSASETRLKANTNKLPTDNKIDSLEEHLSKKRKRSNEIKNEVKKPLAKNVKTKIEDNLPEDEAKAKKPKLDSFLEASNEKLNDYKKKEAQKPKSVESPSIKPSWLFAPNKPKTDKKSPSKNKETNNASTVESSSFKIPKKTSDKTTDENGENEAKSKNEKNCSTSRKDQNSSKNKKVNFKLSPTKKDQNKSVVISTKTSKISTSHGKIATLKELNDKRKDYNRMFDCRSSYLSLSFIISNYLSLSSKALFIDFDVLNEKLNRDKKSSDDPLSLAFLTQEQRYGLYKLMSKSAGVINFYRMFGFGSDLRENTPKIIVNWSEFGKYAGYLDSRTPFEFDNEEDMCNFVNIAAWKISLSQAYVLYCHFKERLSSPYRQIKLIYGKDLWL